jgi:hypothetical protein
LRLQVVPNVDGRNGHLAYLAPLPTAAGDEMTDWRAIEDCGMASRGVILGRFVPGMQAQVVGGFLDVTGVWRVLGRNGGNTKVPFKPTHYKTITWPVQQFPTPNA